MKRLILLILIVLAFAITGCGDDDPAAAPAGEASATAVGESPAATPAPTSAAAGVEATAPAAPDASSSTELTTGAVLTATAAVTGGTPATETAVAPSANMTATLTATACAVEPSADLVGYEGLVEKVGCPLEDAINDPVAIQEYGAGPDYARFMLWFASERQIYVLFPDASWLAYTDTWDESQPEIGCNPDNIDPATSPPLPRRGFGKLWCSVDGVRTALGTIDREERLCQHSVTQRFENGRLVACFEDATIRYFRILNDGAWDMTMVQ